MTDPQQTVLHGAVLFTPSDRPERFVKGWEASAGRLILDLEDSVAPVRKPVAREAVKGWILATGKLPLLRVNGADSAQQEDDRSVLGGLPVAGIIVSKVNAPSDLDAVRAAWPGAALFPLIEAPQGLEAAIEIARASGVRQLLLGALDLHAECGIVYPNPALLAHARLRLVMTSRIARLEPPIDSPHPGVRDHDGVMSDARAAVQLGFAGKLCIHPGQIPCVLEAFRPSEEQLAWAREVIAAAAGGAAVQVRGQMVDAPVLASALNMLARAEVGRSSSNVSHYPNDT